MSAKSRNDTSSNRMDAWRDLTDATFALDEKHRGAVLEMRARMHDKNPQTIAPHVLASEPESDGKRKIIPSWS